uniref:Secreted protein n=1 Tax=Knipowitschia caucasica TaxID=637954 RepID=A0AAV2IRM8_KNICA
MQRVTAALLWLANETRTCPQEGAACQELHRASSDEGCERCAGGVGTSEARGVDKMILVPPSENKGLTIRCFKYLRTLLTALLFPFVTHAVG